MSTRKDIRKDSKIIHSRRISNNMKEKEETENDDYDSEAIFLSVFKSLNEEITTLDELILLLQYAGCNPSKKTMAKFWDDNTDSYTYTQFCAILKQEQKTSKEDLMKAFMKIDRNGDGFITHDELFQILTKKGERMTKAEVKSMMADADFNGDGKLDYQEFCSMMAATTKQCEQLYKTKSSKPKEDIVRSGASSGDEKWNSLKRKEKKKSGGILNEKSAHKDSKSARKDGNSLMAKLSSKHNLATDSDEGGRNKEKILKTKTEPKDLVKWKFEASKGCFYKEDDGSICSHQFQIKITQPTPIWITIKPSAPKYGKFNEGLLDTDMTVYLVEDTSGKLISYSDIDIDDKICLLVDVDIGVYNILIFTSGIKLLMDESESGKVPLAKGTGDDCRLTKSCKDSLMEIFYRCDLDSNGFLNRTEFNEFQKRSSGEECDDEAWDVVQQTLELTPNKEITLNGFLDLNLLEARDPDGGQDELWITLESLGYSHKLLLTSACPFSLEVYVKKGQNQLSLLGISDGGVKLYNAVLDSIKMISETKPIKNKRDLHLHVADFGKRTSIAINNQSHSDVKVQMDCSTSVNLISNQDSLNISTELDSKSMRVVHHLVPDKKDLPAKLKYQESILR